MLASSIKRSKDGRTRGDFPLLPCLSSNESSLTSASHHSPTSVHSASNSWNRRTMPGQIRTRENGSIRPHDITASGASARRMCSSGYVPYSRARIPDQERICAVCEIFARSQDGGLLRWDTNAEGYRDPLQQRHPSPYHRRHARPYECFSTRKEAPIGQYQGVCSR